MNKYNIEPNIKKPKVLITFRKGGENGGPFVSHKRIMESSLKEHYEFIPLMLPAPKAILTFKGIRQLKKQIKNCNPDILHFAGLQLEGFSVLFVAKLAGVKKTLCAIHGSSADAICFRGLKRKIMILLENWTLKHSAACYGVSEFVSKWGRVKKYAKNSHGYIYNMRANEDLNFNSRINMRNEFGIADDEIVVVSTGRIVKDKGFEILLNIILSNSNWDKVRFLIVGDGAYLSEMKDKINQNGLSDKVIFTGFRNDIMYLLSGCDIFVICTLHETLCNSVIEASDAGLPVVATRTGGIPEIVKDKETGYLIEPNDVNGFKLAILSLIKDNNLRKSMGDAGRVLIREVFNENKTVKSLADIYNKLLSE